LCKRNSFIAIVYAFLLMKNYYFILVLLILSSCSLFNDDDGTSDLIFTGTWELVEFVDNEGIPMNEDEPLTLRFFNDDEFGGEADCNNFGGEYEAKKNGSISINSLFSTEALCVEPTLGDDYLNALEIVTTFENGNGELVLFFGGQGQLRYLERLE